MEIICILYRGDTEITDVGAEREKDRRRKCEKEGERGRKTLSEMEDGKVKDTNRYAEKKRERGRVRERERERDNKRLLKKPDKSAFPELLSSSPLHLAVPFKYLKHFKRTRNALHGRLVQNLHSLCNGFRDF